MSREGSPEFNAYEGESSEDYFSAETWTQLLERESGSQRYRSFVKQTTERIRGNVSNPEEIKKFVDLIGCEKLRPFFLDAEEMIVQVGAWDKDEPIDPKHFHPKHFHLALLWHLFNQQKDQILDDLSSSGPGTDQANPYETGLQPWERDVLWRNMFGEPFQTTPEMLRMFESTVSLAFPASVLKKNWDDAIKAGREDIRRDQQGLPMDLLTPPALIPNEVYPRRGTPLLPPGLFPPGGPVVPYEQAKRMFDETGDHSDSPPSDSMPGPQEPEQEQTNPMDQLEDNNPHEGSAAPDAPIRQPRQPPRQSAFVENFSPPAARSIVENARHQDPDRPLYTATEVDAFDQARAQNLNLPQVPTEPPAPEWTNSELEWKREMADKTKELVRKNKESEG